MRLDEALNKYFGFKKFLPGQEEIIRAVLEKEHVLGILPTGGGKSLCFQLPGLMLPGLTLVISPLVALMKDQVDALHARSLYQATYLNSQLPWKEYRQRLWRLKQGAYKLVYLAPERLRSRYFLETIRERQVSLLVVDEAHCVSQWGHDFRPDYLWIPRFYRWLKGNPRLLALTATATPAVQQDILAKMEMPNAHRVIGTSNRPNLFLSVEKVKSEGDKLEALKGMLSGNPGNGIIYGGTRRDCEFLAKWLKRELGIPALYYHAGMNPGDRSAVQERFLRGEAPVIAATNAFGMGINKADIRFVIHYTIPGSLEAYYQEVGRAGRDGLPAWGLLLYAPRDRGLQEFLIKQETVTGGEVRSLVDYIKSRQQGDKAILNQADLQQLDLGETKLRYLISELEQQGLIKSFERTPDATGVLVTGDLSRRNTVSVARQSDKLAEEKRKKLAAMVDYATKKRCRRETILSYFGEKKPGDTGPCCDVCQGI